MLVPCTLRIPNFLDLTFSDCIIKCFACPARCKLAKNTENILIFDASSNNVFFGGTSGSKTFFRAKNFERSKLSRFLPNEFIELKHSLDLTELPKAVIGHGPGAFTGIKTGTAFFLAFAYSLGITSVETISSFRFISLLSGPGTSELRLAVIPFNKGEYFLALLDKESNMLVGDIFTKPPYDNISAVFKNFAGREADLVMPVECGSEIIPELGKIFRISSVRSAFGTPDFERFRSVSGAKTVDITKEPFIIDHVILPANLNNNGNFYVSDQL